MRLKISGVYKLDDHAYLIFLLTEWLIEIK